MKQPAEAEPEILDLRELQPDAAPAGKVYTTRSGIQGPREGAPRMMDLLRRDEEIWDLFTRKEECERCDRDRFGGFPYYKSRHRDVCVPRASQMLMEHGFRCEYPEAQPFAICLTHDIDTVYQPLHSKGFEIVKALKEGNLPRAGRIIPQLRSKKLPAWNFKEILELEESHGACSSFYFLALEKEERECAYAIEDLEQEVCMLQDRGWEVGLHGGCKAYCDQEKLQREKRHLETVLNRNVTGYRNHYLRFQVPETWELLKEAGFLYDTTLGYPDCVGFRNGMCHPFRPFNPNTGQEMDILEIPLVVMDRTLLLHMRLSPEQAWDQMERLLNTTEQHHGVITVLWHNEFMTDASFQFYRKILEYGRDRGAWMTGGREITAWWKKNGLRAPPAQ
jgi:peptidoglycan/xylan/chitin deacetylase (PgdA/CDA1 family)